MVTADPRDTLIYDVIVVGGGPAGATAAYFLSQGGRRVLLLEKETPPRYKTCGGGLSERFLRATFPFSFDDLPVCPVDAVSYHYKGWAATIPVERGAIGMVMRADLDAYLLARCGAEVRVGAAVRAVVERADRVEVETATGGRYAASYLIGADGANSVVARALGLRPRRELAAAIEAEVSVPPSVMTQFAHRMTLIFGEARLGYLWIFPKRDHLSVGIAVLGPKPGELQKTLRRVLAKHGIDLESAVVHGHPIPLYTRREPVSTPRALLAGDAAGLADPISGEGIRLAIHSGRLAAQAVLDGQPARYPADLHREIGRALQLSRALALLFYSLQAPLFFLGPPNPFATQGVADLLAGRLSPVELALLSGSSLPIFHATEIVARVLSFLGQPHLADRLRAAVYPADVNRAYRRGPASS